MRSASTPMPTITMMIVRMPLARCGVPCVDDDEGSLAVDVAVVSVLDGVSRSVAVVPDVDVEVEVTIAVVEAVPVEPVLDGVDGAGGGSVEVDRCDAAAASESSGETWVVEAAIAGGLVADAVGCTGAAFSFPAE